MDNSKIREEFEKYMREKYHYGDLSRQGDGYANYHTQSMWDIYQATVTTFDQVFKEL